MNIIKRVIFEDGSEVASETDATNRVSAIENTTKTTLW